VSRLEGGVPDGRRRAHDSARVPGGVALLPQRGAGRQGLRVHLGRDVRVAGARQLTQPKTASIHQPPERREAVRGDAARHQGQQPQQDRVLREADRGQGGERAQLSRVHATSQDPS
jgi:hypothetical protein